MTPSSPAQVQLPTNAPTPPPVFASSPTGQKPKTKSQNTTFLGAGTLPSMGQDAPKTLLGA